LSYSILSLDGGGVRGVFQATVLRRLAEARPDFLGKIDLLAGTSIGGIQALALAAGATPAALERMFIDEAETIFDDSVFDDIVDLGRMRAADYDRDGLAEVVDKFLGSRTLAQLGKRVLVPAFDLDAPDGKGDRSWKAKFFHNFPEGNDGHWLCRDVALATSAAPTYFPTYKGFADGGIVANNPSVCALAQALGSGQKLDEIRLLSIGTGYVPQHVEGDELDWGFLQWAEPLIGILFDGASEIANFQCSKILGDRYRRINARFRREIKLDDPGAVPELIKIAEQVDLGPASLWIDALTT
jgi:patatin-like phospholipase/acyl hydrolase